MITQLQTYFWMSLQRNNRKHRRMMGVAPPYGIWALDTKCPIRTDIDIVITWALAHNNKQATMVRAPKLEQPRHVRVAHMQQTICNRNDFLPTLGLKLVIRPGNLCLPNPLPISARDRTPATCVNLAQPLQFLPMCWPNSHTSCLGCSSLVETANLDKMVKSP